MRSDLSGDIVQPPGDHEVAAAGTQALKTSSKSIGVNQEKKGGEQPASEAKRKRNESRGLWGRLRRGKMSQWVSQRTAQVKLAEKN